MGDGALVDDIDDRLTELLQSLFRDPGLVVHDQLNANDVPAWDSLNHVNLVIQVEEEFGVRFRNAEVLALANVGDLKRLLRKKLEAASHTAPMIQTKRGQGYIVEGAPS